MDTKSLVLSLLLIGITAFSSAFIWRTTKVRRLFKFLALIFLGPIALLVIASGLVDTFTRQYDKSEECEKVALGMTRDEVIKIMGPSGKEYLESSEGPVAGDVDEINLLYSGPFGADTNPEISINKKTG